MLVPAWWCFLPWDRQALERRPAASVFDLRLPAWRRKSSNLVGIEGNSESKTNRGHQIANLNDRDATDGWRSCSLSERPFRTYQRHTIVQLGRWENQRPGCPYFDAQSHTLSILPHTADLASLCDAGRDECVSILRCVHTAPAHKRRLSLRSLLRHPSWSTPTPWALFLLLSRNMKLNDNG